MLYEWQDETAVLPACFEPCGIGKKKVAAIARDVVVRLLLPA